MDVSFISATLVLPAVLRALVGEGEGEVWRGEAGGLIKPQFEAGREPLGQGGGVGEQGGGGGAVVLIKPQFEAGREHVGKGGIVREQAGREIAIERVRECVAELGGAGSGGTGVEVIESPITGMEGNHEYLLHAWFGGKEA